MKTISFILMVMSFVLLGFIWGLELAPAPHVDTTPIIHVVKNNSGEVLCEIATKSFEAGFDVNQAIKLAYCESTLGADLINESSGTKGLYQFKDETWEHYCKGDVMNTQDNIDCFLALYPIHPSWWECK